MQKSQDQLVPLIRALYNEIKQLGKMSRDPLIHEFNIALSIFSERLLKDLDQWSALEPAMIESLNASGNNYLLDIEIIDQLSKLLLNEFEQSLTEPDIERARRINNECWQIRQLINSALHRPHDARLPSKLDIPVIRQSIDINFQQTLCSPVQHMIDGLERLLIHAQLMATQRTYLETALKNSRALHRILQTARPLIEIQNFTALALLSRSYRSPFCGITGYFYLLLDYENEGLSPFDLDQVRDLTAYSQTVLGLVYNLIHASEFLSGKFIPTREKTDLSHESDGIRSNFAYYQDRFPHLTAEIKLPDTLPCIVM